MKNKEILITGGTGSLGKILVKKILINYPNIKGIRIYSRDEVKQNEFRRELNKEFPDCKVSFLIGDIRDKNRLILACQGVNILIHTAAMKQVPACEYNPLEAIKTNIDGAKNVIYTAIQNNIEKVINISTDKAVYPINLYGCTKAVAEKLFLHANIYAKTKLHGFDQMIIERYPKFSICRYGNVANSRGSIIPLWKSQIDKKEKITLTSEAMTRFWISLNNAADFILNSINVMQGNELFIPNMSSFKIVDLLKLIKTKEDKLKITRIRAGEKLHEYIITNEEYRNNQFCLYDIDEQYFYFDQSNEQSFSMNSKQNNITIKELQEKLNEI